MIFAAVSNWLVAAIAAGASILAAVVTAAASAYAARAKIHELQLSYEQRLQDNYLANARQYMTSVYVPLSVALTRFSEAFLSFRDSLDPETRSVSQAVEEAFRRECMTLLTEISDLRDRGADAFLTSRLEETLISFTTFLRKSLTAQEAKGGAVLQTAFGSVGLPLRGKAFRRAKAVSEALAAMPFVPLFPMIGVVSFESHKVLEAPLTSTEFEARVVEELPAIKALVKEVTLGAHSARSR